MDESEYEYNMSRRQRSSGVLGLLFLTAAVVGLILWVK